jgi:hypothetical protein
MYQEVGDGGLDFPEDGVGGVSLSRPDRGLLPYRTFAL